MAQNFLRARVDALLTQLIWGEAVKIGDDVWRFALASRPFKPFGEIFPATSSDKAAMKDDLGTTSGFLEEGPGFHGMGGDLVRNVASIIEAEKRWHEAPIESMAIAVTDEQKEIMKALQRCAATTEEFLRHGMSLLRMKLDGKKHNFFCSCCGLQFELPVEEGCPLCRAGASLISPLPFALAGNLKKIYED